MIPKVIVTGGAGFIGANLTKKLIGLGYKVVVIDDLSSGRNLIPGAEMIVSRIGDIKASELVDKEIETVFHLAAQIDVKKSVADPVLDAEQNIIEFLRFHGLCREIRVKKFIFASSGGAIYSNPRSLPTPENDLETPLTPYGVAKLTIEKYLQSFYSLFGLPYVALRLANVYGPLQSPCGEAGVVSIFCKKLLCRETVTIYGDGEQTRDFVYVDDVVNAFLAAMRSEASGIFNVGTRKETAINEVYRILQEINDKPSRMKYVKALPGDQRRSCIENRLAGQTLGWKPVVPVSEGLRRTYSWFSNLD